jgi:hypothetical protein
LWIRSENGATTASDVINVAGNDGQYEIGVSVPDGCAVTVEAVVLPEDSE